MDYTSPSCLDEQVSHLNPPCYLLTFSQDSWVSPVTYDPASGLYIQTFPPEHHEFLQKYGQPIEVSDYPDSGWVYADDTEQVQLQSQGFHYREVAASSSDTAEYYEAASMLQYIASPPPWSDDYNACPDTPFDVRIFSGARANY